MVVVKVVETGRGERPVFSLAPGADFTLAAASPGGAASSYTSGLGLGVTTSGSGEIAIGGPVAASQVTLVSEEGVALGNAVLRLCRGPR